jgi:isoquinoline 1-oxidoreductase beta subunit
MFPHHIPHRPARRAGMNRRTFLKVTAVTGAGFSLGVAVRQLAAQEASQAAGEPVAVPPSDFVRIGRDNSVTVIVKHVELGQGTYTGLPTLVAEELDAAWAQIRVEGAPADAKRYGNLIWRMYFKLDAQGTGGSTAMANSFDQYRKAGAAAREMLVAAAAERWKVAPATVRVKDGVVSHPSGKKATFGQLADAAAKQSVPQNPKLKEPKDFVYIGKRVPRTDSKAKSTGRAKFTQDVNLPNMLTAVVAHPPKFGAKVKAFDAAGTRSLPGIRDVAEIPSGIAVVATSFWAAKKGRDALKVEWDETAAVKLSSADILAEYKRLAATPGTVARNDGDAAKALAGAASAVEAAYEFPYLAHAAMEPMNCVVKLDADRCEVWNGEQFHTVDQLNVAQAVGLKPEQVFINQLFAGGSFGRRANPFSDYLVEAATIAKALSTNGKAGVPVKLVWTREDDMRAGYYRPAYYHTLKAGLDANGKIVAWQHRIVGQAIQAGTPFEPMLIKDGIDATSVEGAKSLPYAIPNLYVDLHSPKVGVPVLWWRSVGSTHTAYATETFIDGLAAAAKRDPVEYRRALLANEPRYLGVLELAADKAGWSTPMPARGNGERRGRGIAVHKSFDTYVAQVAEVSVKPDGSFKVDRVVCAVDCGIPVNPDVIRAQMEGGIGYGLSAALHGAITLKDGAVEQSNFHDYPPLRINEMPAIEVYIVQSTEHPTGVGEPATPVIAPAVANALRAATGKQIRALPISVQELKVV